MRDSFIFYRSFFESVTDLTDQDQVVLFRAMCDFALNQKEPDGLFGIQLTLWKLIRPNLDANTKKAIAGEKGKEHGAKGGRPKKTPMGITEKTPKGLLIETPNVDVDVNKDEDVNEKGKKKTKKKTTDFVPPSEIEVIGYFVENGMTEAAAKKAFQYYGVANWIDSKGNAVKNWKQKMQGVWFKEENKAKEVAYTPPPQERTYTLLTDWLKAHPNAYEDSLLGNFMRAGIDPNDHGACRRWLAENGWSVGEATQLVYGTERWMERMSKA